MESYTEKVIDQFSHCNIQKLEERLAARRTDRLSPHRAPLHEAAATGDHKTLDLLLQKAEDGHINCLADSGYTPLHLAASSGHAECVRALLKHNADVNATDEYGKTPRQTAELSSKKNVVRILRSAGKAHSSACVAIHKQNGGLDSATYSSSHKEG